MRALFIFLFFLVIQYSSLAEELSPSKNTPAEIQLFAEKGTFIIDWKSADLNGDGLDDYLIVLEIQKKIPSDPDMNEKQRPVLLLIRQQDDSLKLVKRNDQIVTCSTCGGNFVDGFAGMSIAKNRFSISNHLQGTTAQTTKTYSFAYSRRDETWQLVRIETIQEELFSEEKFTRLKIPPVDYGKIDFSDFNPNNYRGKGEGYQPSKKNNSN